jgi:hypothetical protein
MKLKRTLAWLIVVIAVAPIISVIVYGFAKILIAEPLGLFVLPIAFALAWAFTELVEG